MNVLRMCGLNVRAITIVACIPLGALSAQAGSAAPCAALFAPVRLLPDSPTPTYPPSLKAANVGGLVVASFVVSDAGTTDPATFTVLESSDSLFALAVEGALHRMRFAPACVEKQIVRQLVQQAFVFAPPQAKRPDSATVAAKRAGLTASLRAYSSAQEAFFSDNHRYAGTIKELESSFRAARGTISPGVTVVTTTATKFGWSAMAIDHELSGIICTVAYGTTNPSDGRVVCSGP